MYRWAGEASKQVKDASSNRGYEAESNAFQHISLQTQLVWSNRNLPREHSGVGFMDELIPNQMHGVTKSNEVEDGPVTTGRFLGA